MFTKEWIAENLDEGQGRNLMVAFATIGASGIIEAHADKLLKQTVDGYFKESEADLVEKIKNTRLQVSMMRSLGGFCQQLQTALGDSDETAQN